jgi:hypothetical protein
LGVDLEITSFPELLGRQISSHSRCVA